MVKHISIVVSFILLLALFSCSQINRPPSAPTNPNPAYPSNGAQEVQEFLTLSWSGPDATYTVYLSRVEEYVENESSMALVGTTTSKEIELSFRLDYDTTYYWRVVAQAADGTTIRSEVWSFKTRKNPNSDKVFMTKSVYGSYYYNYLTVFKTNGEPIGTTFLGRDNLGAFEVVADRMYVLYTSDSKTKIVVYDVSDPMNPSVLEEKTFNVYLVPEKIFVMKVRILVLDVHNLNAIYSLDLETGKYEEIIDNVWYAFLEDNLLFVGASGPKFKVYNISDPDSPVLLREVNTFGMDFYPDDFVVDGDRIFKMTSSGLEIYNLETLEKLGSVETGINESVEDFVYNKDRLAVKSTNHITVFDLSDQSSPNLVRTIETGAKGFYIQDGILVYSEPDDLTILDLDSSEVLYEDERLLKVFGDKLKVVDGKLFSSGYVMNVVDVSDPHLPKKIATYDLGYTLPWFNKSIDIETYGDRIFASLELPGGDKVLAVFDLDGSNLTLVSTPISDQAPALFMNLELIGNTIYVNRYSPGEIYSVDVDTLATSLVSTLPSNAWSMTGCGNKLYVSMTDGTLLVYNVENPDSSWRIEIGTVLDTTMKSDGDYVYGESTESGNNNFYIIDLSSGNIVFQDYLPTRDFVVDGDRLYVLDSSYLKIYDITNRSSPTEISRFGLLNSGYYGIYKSGDLLYIIGSSGLWIIDVSNEDPKPIFHDTKLEFSKMDN